MRKLFLLVVIVMAAITASAQEGIYLGGGISLWRNNDVDKTSFSITPDVGYNLSEKWAVGAELAYAHKGYDEDYKVSTNAFAWLRMHVTLSMKTRLYVCSWIWDLDSLLTRQNMRIL